MKKLKLVIFCVIAIVGLGISGCGVAMMAGDLARSAKKDVDIVLSPGVTSESLSSRKNIGVNIIGVTPSTGQYMFATGTGSTNANVYSDMITKEFMKLGYQSQTIPDSISESTSKEKLSEFSAKGFDMILIGNMNISTTTSTLGFYTGGDYMNTGVISFTVKGLDPTTGKILFMISTEYGKAKNAGEVSKSLAELYRDMVMGKVKPTNDTTKI